MQAAARMLSAHRAGNKVSLVTLMWGVHVLRKRISCFREIRVNVAAVRETSLLCV